MAKQTTCPHLEILPHASRVPGCECRILLLVPLRGCILGRSSSSLCLSLSHDVTQGQVPSGIRTVSYVPAMVLVLEVLSQDGVFLECLATSQTVDIACSTETAVCDCSTH